MTRYSTQSSANSLTLDVMLVVMSLMYNKNISGPKTVPCGTPESILNCDP